MKTLVILLFLVAAASLGSALPTSANATLAALSNTLPPEATKELDQALSGAPLISAKCMTTLFGLIVDPDFAKCFPLPVMLEFLPILLDPKAILKDPTVLEKPLTDFCAVAKCDGKVIDKAVAAIQDGCKDDASNIIVEGLIAGLSFYSPIRDILCFKDKDFCLIQEVGVVVKLPPSPVNITGDPILDSVMVADPTLMCTKCSKDIANTLFNFVNANPKLVALLTPLGVTPDLLQKGAVGCMVKCGAAFLDGKIP